MAPTMWMTKAAGRAGIGGRRRDDPFDAGGRAVSLHPAEPADGAGTPTPTTCRLSPTLADSGKIFPVIDRSYPTPEAAHAIRYLRCGRPRGKLVITT